MRKIALKKSDEKRETEYFIKFIDVYFIFRPHAH